MIDPKAALAASFESKPKFDTGTSSGEPTVDDCFDSSGEQKTRSSNNSMSLRDTGLDSRGSGVAELVDVVVIGMRPGGEFVAGELLDRGLKVVAIESELMGGECADWGCVPTKMMVRAANLLAEAGRVNEVAGSASVTSDWTPVARRIREEATPNFGDAIVEVCRRDGRFMIRPRHPENVVRTSYTGTPTYPPSVAWVIDGTLIPYDPPSVHHGRCDRRRFGARVRVTR